MKSRPITDYSVIEKKFNEELNKAFTGGLSYGAKAFCQVVKDKLDGFDGEDKSVLIEDITQFVDKTLENSVESIQAAFASNQERINRLLGKDDVSE